MSKSVQEEYAPTAICFGCGPANAKGLRIRSAWENDSFIARWRPEPHHQAFPGVLNGGICGALLDCHSNWCAVTTLMKERGLTEAPSCVTADFHVKLRRPTPVDQELLIMARPVKIEGDSVLVEAEIRAGEKVTATCTGTFVAVKPGHPAYHRWS